MCLYPRLIKNKKYVPNKKNGGVIPDLPKIMKDGKWVDDERVTIVPVGCGKCMECLKQKANNWRVRLLEEVKSDNRGHFVTFTFSNESLVDLRDRYFKESGIDGYLLDNEIAKKAIRLFLERWRKEEGVSVKHWFISELGHEGTENVHLHGLIWTDKSGEYIRKKWNYGFIWDSVESDGYVNERTVNYIIKYCTKLDEKHKEYKPIILCSKGIGGGYFNRIDYKLNKFKGKKTDSSYKSSNGYRMGLPIYYRNKIYSDSEREVLWQLMLDEEVRYVDGVKISIEDNDDEYWRVLQSARKKNKRLGFGSDAKNWDKVLYERERRRIMHKKRGL